MRFYTANVNLDGDVRHVVQKRGITAAEIMVLQAVHGHASVHNITQEPQQKAKDNTSHKEVGELLDRRYGRVRVGPESNLKPVLPSVFPGWPNVKFPRDAEDAGIDSELMAEDTAPKKTTRRKTTKKTEPEPEPEPETASDDDTDTSFTE